MVTRLLVVDDHPAVALALKVALKADGRFAIAASAETAEQGLERLPQHDVVLLDLHMPDMEGPELVRAFRERAPDALLILHSAADDTPEVDAVRGLVDAVVLKGRPAEVVATLVRLTGG
jgi:DNA-binding NarL/FixJ family response regulator